MSSHGAHVLPLDCISLPPQPVTAQITIILKLAFSNAVHFFLLHYVILNSEQYIVQL